MRVYGAFAYGTPGGFGGVPPVEGAAALAEADDSAAATGTAALAFAVDPNFLIAPWPRARSLTAGPRLRTLVPRARLRTIVAAKRD